MLAYLKPHVFLVDFSFWDAGKEFWFCSFFLRLVIAGMVVLIGVFSLGFVLIKKKLALLFGYYLHILTVFINKHIL